MDPRKADGYHETIVQAKNNNDKWQSLSFTIPMKTRERGDYLKKLIQLVQQAGKKLLRFQKQRSRLPVFHKKNQGIASTADLEVENFVIGKLRKIYPQAYVLAEEDSYQKSRRPSSHRTEEYEYAWAVDALDGTNNFLSGMDYYCISIALLNYGNPILGIVYRPATEELFYALANQGGFKKLPKKRARSLYIEKNMKKISDCLFVTGFSLEKGKEFDREFEIFKNVTSKGRGIRRMGSAALDLCYVAEGIFDCFWEQGLSPWDVSAAGLICIESGVKVTDYKNKIFSPFQGSIIASRNPLYGKFIKEIL